MNRTGKPEKSLEGSTESLLCKTSHFKIGPAPYSAVCSGLKGYLQIPMDEDSAYLTTILLPTGKYLYKRAPMGLSSSSDEWKMRSDAAVAGLEGVAKEVDDILIQAPDCPTLRKRLKATLDRCRQHCITRSKQ